VLSFFPDDLIAGRAVLPVLLSYDLFLGTNNTAENVSLITFYLMGADAHVYKDAPGNYWTTLKDWPQATTQYLYFGDFGQLTAAPPAVESTSTWKYDPKDPVPTIGGNNLFIPCGPMDQRPVEQGNRSDVFTFTSAALTTPLALVGPIVATIWVSSDQVDTDFTIKVTDVYPFPNDNSRLIQDGLIRMRLRDYSVAQNITPGQIYAVEISLWHTAYVYDVDHRIRVSISSSNYPRFSASPNNGWPLNTTVGSEGPIHVATNTLYHGPKHPSSISLPVVSLDEMPSIHIYDAWVPQVEKLYGKDLVQKLLDPSTPSMLDRMIDPSFQAARIEAAKSMGSLLMDEYP